MAKLYLLFLLSCFYIDKILAYCTYYFLLFRNFYPKKYSKSILIIRPDAIGDMLISLCAIEVIYRHFHKLGYEIVLINSNATKAIMESCPFIDKAITIDVDRLHRSFSYNIDIYKKLATIHPEYAVNLRFLPKQSTFDHKLTLLSGALHKCTIDGRSFVPSTQCINEYAKKSNSIFKRFLKKLLTNKSRCQALLYVWCNCWRGIYDICPFFNEKHDIYTYEKKLVQVLCEQEYKIEPHFPNWLNEEYVEISKPYYVVAPSASSVYKSWPEDKFIQIIKAFAMICPFITVVLTGTSKDIAIVDKITSALPANINYVNLCGKTNVQQLASIIKNSHFVVSNDSGTAHIAGLLRKEEIVLVCGGHYGLYFPNHFYNKAHVVAAHKKCFNCNFLCYGLIDKRLPCIIDIKAKQVLKLMANILQSHSLA